MAWRKYNITVDVRNFGELIDSYFLITASKRCMKFQEDNGKHVIALYSDRVINEKDIIDYLYDNINSIKKESDSI